MPVRSRRFLIRVTVTAAAVALGVSLAVPMAAAAAVPTAAKSVAALSVSDRATPQPVVDADAAAPRAVDLDAQFFLTIARTTLASAAGKVDVTDLQGRIDRLADPQSLSVAGATASLTALRAETAAVAEERNAYDAAAARAAAAAAKAAQQAADALAQANTPDGARATARQMAADRYGWGDGQFQCLNSLWQKESGWNYQAYNPSGATGIPQALPGSKMASAGSDWQTVAATQISWGLDYISRAYGTPCGAWSHSQATNWY
ncbi:phospholipase [Microbacterium sp. cx-55]|uniref:aggregation-promoting factor C-terminal-like domain-containing protein n=1 Tax=unclassified Microbacterium TaxID=2609290 RepID=UPI001CBDB9F4|nr:MULTISPECIES: phospholipase [unclassified Microbacterium]MBZ4487233.1 phospholipase [Microbacterium sp. cx-55]MCC4908649.1 phospholipase [Microbacterium sp. cx-59]UGB35257.1 phospholipase [Microbacterium sp. cx-55]